MKETDICECVAAVRNNEKNCRKVFGSGLNRKRTSHVLLLFYAGLLAISVPSVVCNSDWTNHLSYDSIYNFTDSLQLRPYHLPIEHSFIQEQPISHSNSYINQVPEPNEIDYDRFTDYREGKRDKLLVGFARDPFRQSVPEDEYAGGNQEASYYKSEGRGKRGVVHLYNMIHCGTGCDPLTYKGYGCYCGFLGSGRPVDGIDRCCQMHDRCYENIYCPFYTVYFQPYYWKCYHGTPLCALENYDTSSSFVNGCAARLCECDRLFAMCVRRYRCPSQHRPAPLCRSSPLRLLQNILRQIGK